MSCAFVKHEDGIECVRCGRIVRSTNLELRATCRKPGLGDRLAKWLGAIGVRKWPGCGCEKRQAKLNAWEATARRRWLGLRKLLLR